MPDLAGGGAAASDPLARYYYGYSGNALAWTSLVWAGLHTVVTLTNVSEIGIARVDSNFTVAEKGVYVFDFRATGYNTTGNDTLALRARKAGATIASLQAYTEAAAARVASLHLMFVAALQAADVVSLEYAAGPAAYNSFGPITVDSESARGAVLAIYKIGRF